MSGKLGETCDSAVQSWRAGCDELGVVAAAPLDVGKLNEGKALCHFCGYLVNPVGHQVRCRQPTQISTDAQTFAWLGDAAWELLARRWILIENLPMVMVQGLTGNASLSTYLDAGRMVVECGVNLTPNSNAHSRGTLVEASYALSAEVRFEVLQHFGVEYARGFGGLWTPVLDSAFDSALEEIISPTIDGYCYMRLLDPTKALGIARQLGRYPTLAQVIAHIDDPLSIADYYVMYRSGSLHVFDGPHPMAYKVTTSVSQLLSDHSTPVGAVKDCDVSALLLDHDIQSGWPIDVISCHQQLVAIFRHFHFAGAVPFHAMVTASAFNKYRLLLYAPRSEVDKSAVRSLLQRSIACCDAAVALLQARVTGYIATSGVLAFEQVQCCDIAHIITQDASWVVDWAGLVEPDDLG